MLGHVELLGPAAKDVVDESRGQIEEEFAADRGEGTLDAHAVVEEAFQDEVPDPVIVLGLGKHTVRGVVESRATVTAGLILAVGDLEEGDRFVGHGADSAGAGPFAAARLTTVWAWGGLASTGDRDHGESWVD